MNLKAVEDPRQPLDIPLTRNPLAAGKLKFVRNLPI